MSTLSGTKPQSQPRTRSVLGQRLGNLLARFRGKPERPAPAFEPPPTPAGRPADTVPSGTSLLGRLQGSRETDMPAGSVDSAPNAPATVPFRVELVSLDCLHPSDDRHWAGEPDPRVLELAESVRRLGVIQPLIVVPLTGSGPGSHQYQVILGNRRLRAAWIAGVKTVPVIIRAASPALGLQLALAEDVNRIPLTDLERGRMFAWFGRSTGLGPAEVADRFGCDRSRIDRAVALLSLDPPFQAALGRGELTAEQGRVLLEAPTPERRQQLCALALRHGWSPERMRRKLAHWQAQGAAG